MICDYCYGDVLTEMVEVPVWKSHESNHRNVCVECQNKYLQPIDEIPVIQKTKGQRRA